MKKLLLLILVNCVCDASAAQQPAPPSFGPLPGTAEAVALNTRRLTALRERGTRVEGEHVIVWFAPALSREWAQALVARLDPAVGALRRHIGSHSWQRLGTDRVTYFLVDEAAFPSYLTPEGVFMSVASIRAGRTLYLADGAFAMLMPKDERPDGGPRQSDPMWFLRGLIDYLSKTAGTETGFHDDIEGDIFASGLPSQVDILCAMRATSPEGVAMLAHIGAFTRPAELAGPARATYGAPFYACATSFTKYLIDLIGLAPVVNLFPTILEGKMEMEIVRLTNRSISTLRAEWQRKIGLASR